MIHKFITIGEIMLRLTPPNYDIIRMANSFEASYGGAEANIALALANLGIGKKCGSNASLQRRALYPGNFVDTQGDSYP